MTYWFKPKRYGVGASPANWKGWLITLAFMVPIAAFLTALVSARDHLSVGLFAAGVVAFVAMELLFVWIAWKKTDGDWRWRWGPDDNGKQKTDA